MLDIRNLAAKVAERPTLKGIDLHIGPGEVHAIMGPNGAGKSTLAKVLAGDEAYTVTGGSVTLDGADVLAMAPEQRAAAGLFLGFQYPVEIPGVTNVYFLRTAINAQRKQRGEPEIPTPEFLKKMKEVMRFLDIDEQFRNRFVNVGFSGGEKKRNEILQLLLLDPRIAVLDEIDSGLDIDALKVVAKGVNSLRDGKRSVLLVTHYQRLLDYIEPDVVHVLVNGKIVRSGDKSLALELEAEGYAPMRA